VSAAIESGTNGIDASLQKARRFAAYQKAVHFLHQAALKERMALPQLMREVPALDEFEVLEEGVYRVRWRPRFQVSRDMEEELEGAKVQRMAENVKADSGSSDGEGGGGKWMTYGFVGKGFGVGINIAQGEQSDSDNDAAFEAFFYLGPSDKLRNIVRDDIDLDTVYVQSIVDAPSVFIALRRLDAQGRERYLDEIVSGLDCFDRADEVARAFEKAARALRIHARARVAAAKSEKDADKPRPAPKGRSS
jgi:hypothetical protein